LEWHYLPDTKAREVILLMIISETPLKLKAGNFIDLSLKTFSNVSDIGFLLSLSNNKVSNRNSLSYGKKN